MERAGQASVSGTCTPEFELVRQEFERNFASRGEVGAAVTIMVDGTTVADLWGGTADEATGRPWDEDTMVIASWVVCTLVTAVPAA